MITQKLTIRLDETELPVIRMVSGDIGREIQIEVYAREDSENPIDLETYSAEITLIKPDNTFIMDNFTVDKYELPEQAGAVSGFGYYQIKIFTAGSHQIYTGQGPFLVDDMILSDDVIESSSIAFGDRFPEDFATKTWVDDEIAAAGIGTYVAGNVPEEETKPPLVKLQINDDIYPLIHKVEEQEDVDITNPAEGDVLTYDADDQKWKNEPLVIPDPTVTKTATGNPIEITDGADAPLVKCVTQITGYQSGTGTPSPDNIRPIVAYSTGEIEVGGNNLFDGIFRQGSAILLTNNIRIVSENLIRIEQGKTYTFSASSYVGFKYVLNANRNQNYLPFPGNAYGECGVPQDGWKQEDITFTATANGYLAIVAAMSNDSNIEPSDVDGIEFLFEEGSTATAPTTHTTTYPSAIYRGSEDVVKGEVTTEWGMIASYAGETLPGEWISDRDEYAPGTTPTTGAQVAYELATPTTSSVTPTNLPIKSLSGYTHIESSTGDMEVEYITQGYEPLQHLHYYSTEEQVVGKWIDGKDVYERTISFTLAASADYTSVTLAAIANIETVWAQTAFGIHTSGGVLYTSPLGPYTASPTETDFGGFLVYNNGIVNLEYRCGQFLWSGTANIVLRYTKTA